MPQHDIFESLIAIVAENQTMASILRDQCLLYGFKNTLTFTGWNALLATLAEQLPDLIVADQAPVLQPEQAAGGPAALLFAEMIPVVLYAPDAASSAEPEAVPKGLTIVASLRGRNEQQRLLEVIHAELDKRVSDVGEFVLRPQPKHLNIVVSTADRELGDAIRQVLEAEGYYVRVAANGMETLEYIEGVLPHIVLLDYQLPQVNSLPVLEWLKTASPETAVLLMGDDDSPQFVAELLKAGVHSYLKKPFELKALPLLCKGLAHILPETKAHTLEAEQQAQLVEELAALKKSEENLKTLINASGDIIFRISPQGFLNFATPAVKEQLGYTWDNLEVERINIAKFVHPLDFMRVMTGIRQVIRGSAMQGLECRLMHEDRVNFRWYSINCYPMYTGQKQFVGVGGIAREIGSIKKFEQEIRTQNERLSALNEIAGILSQSLKLDEILQNVLAKVLEILRFHAGAVFLPEPETRRLLLQNYMTNAAAVPEKQVLLQECAQHQALLQAVFEPGRLLIVEDIAQHPQISQTSLAARGFRTLAAVPLRSKDVSQGLLLLLAREQRSVAENDRQLLTSIGHQVGLSIENINLYQQEIKAKERLEQLNKLKDDFVAIVSHDLRSPLTAILAAAEILLADELMDRPLTAEQKELVHDIQVMGNQQLQMVNDLLDLAKIESGKQELNPTMVDLRTVVGQSCHILRVLAENKNIALHFLAAANLPRVRIDVPKIQQVVNNLIGNAIKFTQPGGAVTIRIDVENHQFLRVSVSDTGEGMEPENLLRLFNKFQQVKSSGTRGERGTGLGLAICKNLVELHQGEIWAESRVGVGSNFVFTLPLPECVVLIIDDSLTVITSIKMMLAEHLSYVHVNYALNGPEGLRLAEETAPMVVILDYLMPDMDGLTIFRKLKERYGSRTPPTIFLTASQDLEVRRQIFELGAADYLQKPIDVSDLLPRISRFL